MIDPSIKVDDDVIHEEIVENRDVETSDDKAKNVVGDNIVTPKKLKPILRPPPPFP